MIDHTKALNFYKENQKGLVEKYNGKTLVLQNDNIIHVASSFQEAYEYASQKLGIGNFSLQEVAPGESSYTVHISTPQVFI